MKPLALILALTLCACSSPRTDIGNGSIRVRFADSEEWQAAWEHSTRTIYVTSQAGHAWLAHESIHASESLRIPMDAVLDLVGPLEGYESDIALARQVAREGGDWTALYRICGPQAVRHPEILASIKLQLAMGKK
jgi:hypothetical protein